MKHYSSPWHTRLRYWIAARFMRDDERWLMGNAMEREYKHIEQRVVNDRLADRVACYIDMTDLRVMMKPFRSKEQ